jgi:gluconate 2-dehydrogenase gamma chain
VTGWLTASQHRVVEAACERLVPGSSAGGVVHYVDGYLGAFDEDPPRIWARTPRGSDFHDLSPLEEQAWRQRIAELQQRYTEGLRLLGDDFADVAADEQDRRLADAGAFTTLLYEHACEGMYGAPAYGGNRDLAGWRSIGFEGDVQPRGYSPDEVSQP